MTPRGPPRAPRRVAAFFDFDDTVLDTSAGRLFGRELMRIRWRRAMETRPGTLGWVARVLGHVLRMLYLFTLYGALLVLHRLRLVKRSRVVRVAYRQMRGWSVSEIESLARDYFEDVLAHRLYPEAVRRMQEHKDQGHLVVVATTNMHVLVERIRKHAPVDDIVATEFVVKDGRLTGAVTGPTWGQEKAEAVRAWAHANDVSLPKSSAHSDHFSDHPFLGLVGHPVAVNPDRRLRRMARRKGWPVLRFEPARRKADEGKDPA